MNHRLPFFFLAILATSLTSVETCAEIPTFVLPGFVATYSGTVDPLVGTKESSSQEIAVETVTSNPNYVSGSTVVKNYLGGSTPGGNYAVIDGYTNPLMWNCDDPGCLVHLAPLGTITQFWVDPIDAAASIIGPNSETYTQLKACPASVPILNVTCLESTGPVVPLGGPTYHFVLGFDTSGFVRYSFQNFEPLGTFQGKIGQLEYFAQTSIPWQIAGANVLLQTDVANVQGKVQGGEVQVWQNGVKTPIDTPDASWHIISTNYLRQKQNFDVVWQNNNGAIAIWEFNGTNGTNRVLNGVVGTTTPGWRAVGTGDFFGRNVSDILFQNNSGEVAIWQMNGLQATPYDVVPGDIPPPGWHAIGTGDFNGDGFADILFQHDDGAVAIWEMKGNNVILYGYVDRPEPGWHAVGTGNFFRPQVSDILFQHDNGAVAIWEMNEARVLTYGYVDNPGLGWHVLGVCDCNQDGRLGDILLQNDNGDVMIWEMTGTSYVRKSLGNPGAGLHL
jgi:hypothetical protein